MAQKLAALVCASIISVSLLAGCGNKEVVSTQESSADTLRVTQRQSACPIDRLILHRWSSRAFSGEPVSDEQLMQLFEAARWAPSSYNNQPWRFIYAKRGTPAWDTFFNLMVDFNKSWTHNAAALILVLSAEKTEKGQPITTHTFDTGAAWQNLGLQATSMGLIAHGMAGFDYAKAKEALHIPEGYTIEALIAVGHPGSADQLPEHLRGGETMPAQRNPVSAFAFEGTFPRAQDTQHELVQEIDFKETDSQVSQ